MTPGYTLPTERHSAMPERLLSFVAEHVGSDTTKYTPLCVGYMVSFGTGDPEADGHSWNFSRSLDDDWGVCTVREIERATVYGGIESFTLNRSGVECAFDADAADETGFRALRITFAIDDSTWHQLVATAKVVFRDCPYFTIRE